MSDRMTRNRARTRFDFPYFRSTFNRATAVLLLAVLPALALAAWLGPLAGIFAGAAMIVVVLAVTSRLVRRMEEERRRARSLESSLERIAQDASAHRLALGFLEELKGSFASLGTTVNLLETEAGESPEVRENLLVLRSMGRRGRNLVERFQAAVLAPVETECVTDVNLNTMVEELVDFTSFETYQRQIQVKLVLEADLPTLRSEYGRVRQVLMNLFLNAMIAVDRSGMIRIATRRDGSSIELTMTDSGPGLPPGGEERVFDALYTTRPDAVGLGLTLCRSVLERMGGSIAVGNEPDLGARFIVRMPIGHSG